MRSLRCERMLTCVFCQEQGTERDPMDKPLTFKILSTSFVALVAVFRSIHGIEIM